MNVVALGGCCEKIKNLKEPPSNDPSNMEIEENAPSDHELSKGYIEVAKGTMRGDAYMLNEL